jgi:hypothetical protein
VVLDVYVIGGFGRLVCGVVFGCCVWLELLGWLGVCIFYVVCW